MGINPRCVTYKMWIRNAKGKSGGCTARLSRPCGASLEAPAVAEAMAWQAREHRRILGHRFRFTEHADFTVNSLGVISHRHIQTQRTRILDRIYRMSRMGCKDRWKLRYAGIPRLRLGNNGKPWSTKISSLIFVSHGFPFFQAIQPSQFL
jgi:hypothetical protein